MVPGGRLQATSFTFDADRGSPSAGFRLGFPTIQGLFNNTQNQRQFLPDAYAFWRARRVAASGRYQCLRSCGFLVYAVGEGGNGSLMVRTTDGTQLAYWSINSKYRCTEVKDRNGNYLSIKYDPINGTANLGRMTAIVDTLGRTINFNYDSNYRLLSITRVVSYKYDADGNFLQGPRAHRSLYCLDTQPHWTI